jgi:hypothetical protein
MDYNFRQSLDTPENNGEIADSSVNSRSWSQSQKNDRFKDQKNSEEEENKKEDLKEAAIKEKMQKAAKQALEKIKKYEPSADLKRVKQLKKVVTEMAKSDNLDAEEKEKLDLNKNRISKRAAELLASSAGDEPGEELAPEQALSLAINEQMTGDDIDIELNYSKDDSADQTSRGLTEDEPMVKPFLGRFPKWLVEASEIKLSSVKPDRPSATDEFGESEGNESIRVKRSNIPLAGVVVGMFLRGSRNKPATNIGVYGYGGSGDVKLKNLDTTGSDFASRPVSSNQSYKKQLELIAAQSIFEQIKFRKYALKKAKSIGSASHLPNDDISRIAPKSESIRSNIKEKVELYAKQDSSRIVDRPQQLERGWGSSDLRMSGINPGSETSISTSRAELIYDRSLSAKLADDYSSPGSSDKTAIYNRSVESGVVPEKIILSPDPDRLESHFSIKKFETYLETITLNKKPKSAKDLKLRVEKSLGRKLTLPEKRNIDNFWMNREAKLKRASADIITRDEPGAEEVNIEYDKSGAKSNHVSMPSGLKGYISTDESRSYNDPSVTSQQDNAMPQFGAKSKKVNFSDSPGSNLILTILAISALISAIIYAIIIMI